MRTTTLPLQSTTVAFNDALCMHFGNSPQFILRIKKKNFSLCSDESLQLRIVFCLLLLLLCAAVIISYAFGKYKMFLLLFLFWFFNDSVRLTSNLAGITSATLISQQREVNWFPMWFMLLVLVLYYMVGCCA